MHTQALAQRCCSQQRAVAVSRSRQCRVLAIAAPVPASKPAAAATMEHGRVGDACDYFICGVGKALKCVAGCQTVGIWYHALAKVTAIFTRGVCTSRLYPAAATNVLYSMTIDQHDSTLAGWHPLVYSQLLLVAAPAAAGWQQPSLPAASPTPDDLFVGSFPPLCCCCCNINRCTTSQPGQPSFPWRSCRKHSVMPSTLVAAACLSWR